MLKIREGKKIQFDNYPQHRQMVQPQTHQIQPGVITVQQVHIQKPAQRFVQQDPPDNGQ